MAVCEIASYTIISGYMSVFPGGVVADEPRRTTTLTLDFVKQDAADDLSFATVEFVDQGSGPLGQVTGHQVRAFLPRGEFPAFWHAIRGGQAVVSVAWNDHDELTEFLAISSDHLAPNSTELQRHVDSLRRELRRDTGV
jgi:hypothetical protein